MSSPPPSAPIPDLSSTQRKKLRGLAHDLEPVVRLGRSGLTEAASAELERALAHHELIKVKIAADRDERRDLVGQLAERVPCVVIGTIGQIAILYRPHEDPEKRRVRV